jgi:uncharacterized membrane protein YtjA (UPF0391 family)
LKQCRLTTPKGAEGSRTCNFFISTLRRSRNRDPDGTKPGSQRSIGIETGEPNMLYYALVFLVVALIAGVLGFGGIAGASAGIAKILFGIFIILFLISLAMRLFRQA